MDEMVRKPRLALTMGDPAGVGPEIALKVMLTNNQRNDFTGLLVGSVEVFREAAQLLDQPVSLVVLESPDDADALAGDLVGVIEPKDIAGKTFPRQKVAAECGEAAFQSIKTSIELALDGSVDAVVTNPIHKKSLNLAGYPWAGHTELFREFTNAKDSAMMLVAGDLRVVHVSTHCSLGQAVRRCKRQRIVDVTKLAHEAMLSLGIDKPRIGMAALNPHAGDGGLFGDEEAEEIVPAIVELRGEGLDVSDPMPPDTVFCMARGGRFDVVIAQYHDQGHIPVKMEGFYYDHQTGSWPSVEGINVTLGLPILRVSVDHGTAFDQAWQGSANADSLQNALDFTIAMRID